MIWKCCCATRGKVEKANREAGPRAWRYGHRRPGADRGARELPGVGSCRALATDASRWAYALGLDLLDRTACEEKLSLLPEITHVFGAAYLERPSFAEEP